MEGRDHFLRQIEAGEAKKSVYGALELDLRTRKLRNTITKDTEILTPSEYQICWALFRANGGLIAETELIDFIHEDDPDEKDLPLGNSVAVQIYRLRQKMNAVSNGSPEIETVRGFGYKMNLGNQ